jgi:hypothetical protein
MEALRTYFAQSCRCVVESKTVTPSANVVKEVLVTLSKIKVVPTGVLLPSKNWSVRYG